MSCRSTITRTIKAQKQGFIFLHNKTIKTGVRAKVHAYREVQSYYLANPC